MLTDYAPYELDEPCLSSNMAAGGFSSESTSSPNSIQMDQHLDCLRRSRLRYSSLSIAEERILQDIAMPYRIQPNAVILKDNDSASSPELEQKTLPRKRKSSSHNNRTDAAEITQSKKRGHNAIERRYRTNINDKIMALRESIPSLRTSLDGEAIEYDVEDDDTKENAQKYGKAEVLTRAVEYISHIEDSIRRLGLQSDVLKARIFAFEKLAVSGSTVMSNSICSQPHVSESLETIQAEFRQIRAIITTAAPALGALNSSR